MIIRKKKLLMLILMAAFVVCGSLNLQAAQKKYIVVIDPAHGGDDAGVKISDKISEKDITLAIALDIQKELAKEDNLEVILTRTDNKSINIEDRRKNIVKIKPDIILSIHANSGFGKKAAGFELYYPGFREVEDKTKASKSTAKDSKNKYLNDSVRFAQLVQKNLDILFPRKGRGLREADTPIIEGIAVPALVVELGFVTNPEEKKLLLSNKMQEEIARSLSKSIKSFFR